MAIVAVANVAAVGRRLGMQVTSSFAPLLTCLYLLWTYLVIIIHISGATTLRLRIKIKSQSSWHDRLAKEFTPTHQRELHDFVQPKQEGYWFTVFSQFTAFLSVCYLIYGTLTLSSITFISVRDGVTVIARYMASVICCRLILIYELACLRDAYIKDPKYSPVEFETLSNAPKPGNQFRTQRNMTWRTEVAAITVLLSILLVSPRQSCISARYC
jgi:hypothetical protein